MEQKKVMIIEDDDFLRSLVVTKLQKAGYAVVTNPNGENALANIQSEKPDLILLDLMLPAVSGFDILAQVRGDSAVKTTKIIVFSNLGDEADIAKCKTLGVTDYLVKSNFTLDEVITKVGQVIA